MIVEPAIMNTVVTPGLRKLQEAFQSKGFDVRLVGGVVRDLMRGVQPKDVDLCTDADPVDQIMVYKMANLFYVETGLKHGTITVRVDGEMYEITSLRTEANHDGRHAEVAYTRDWLDDLGRRDLTFNSMSLTFDGELFDPFGGLEDLNKGIVRFVGNPDDRMREDYLRILRWLRFHGRIAPMEPLDTETVEAAVRHAAGLRDISRERVWMEFAKIIVGPAGANLIDSMYDLEIASHIDLPMGMVPALRVIRSFSDNPITLMVALLNTGYEWPDMATRWKWSAEERDLANFLVKNREKAQTHADYKRLLAHEGHPVEWVTELARLNGDLGTVMALAQWEIPIFPVKGQDLLDAGMKPGPEMGQALKRMKTAWADSNYTLTKDELL
jgi:tRNA nucleotidyltransferase (CCA-adding enzyme)